jgi:hypothetical protein
MKKCAFVEEPQKLLTVAEARERYRLSRETVVKYAKTAGAFRKFGKSARIDMVLMDQYIDEHCRE